MKHLWQAAMEALENGIRENDLFFEIRTGARNAVEQF
jgi:hypothetical protein